MAEYFSHDYDAREDEKIIDLMAELNWAGYGQYWGIIELLYKNNGKMRTQYERIAFALNSHPDSIKTIIENFDLFKINNGFFYSVSVNKRLKKRKDKSDKARDNAYKRWNKEDANAMPPQCEGNAKKESKESKEIKENIYRSFDHLSITIDEFKKLEQFWRKETIDSILDRIENYKDNKKYKSLYLTAKNWIKDEPKRPKML